MATSNTDGAGGGDTLSPGDRIGGGRYLLKRLLGRSASAQVWLAQDAKASRTVALKFFPRALLTEAGFVDRLKQRAGRHVLVRHPHIATTYELVQDASMMALAVEFIDGWSLASMKVDRLGGYYLVEEIEDWVGQLCMALEYAHQELGIIHGDLKPANLLMNAQEELKVTDFEIAALIRKESSRLGLVKGHYNGLGFLSPQQATGAEPSKLDDIYSLGATIFDLLTGTAPFYKGEIFAQICGQSPPSMTERLKELGMQDEPISPVWEDMVTRCLAKEPAGRPQTVGEVLELLKRANLPKPTGLVTADEPAKTDNVTVPETKKEGPEQLPQTAASETAPPEAEVPEKNALEITGESQTTPPVPLPVSPSFVPVSSRSQMPLILGGIAILFAAICAAAVIGFITLRRETITSLAHEVSGTNAMVALVPGAPGSVDTAFNTGDGANGEVYALAIQPDGKILAAGRFNTFNGSERRNLVRLNPDGSLDEMFKYQGNGAIHTLALSSGGGIFVAGVSMVKGRPRYHIQRLDGDGGVDKTFDSRTFLNLEIRSLALQSDGAVVVGGNFTRASAKKQERIMRFGPDGQPDEDFDANVSAPDSVWALRLQPDGKILVGGGFTQINGTDACRLARLNADGTLDKQFNVGTGADGTVETMVLQPDGAIIIGGLFTHVNGQPCPHVARLNPDGTVDTTFAIGAGADKNVRSLALQPDGKIIVVGEFVTFENIPCHRVVRLNPDGSVDKSFDTGGGAANFVDCAALQSDGKILLSGGFTAFNGVATGELVRLNNVHPRP